MGFSSQAGHVVLKTQALQGVLADLDTGIGMKVKGGSLGPNRDLLIPDAEIGGGRDVTDAELGAASWGGSYDFYARMESLLTLFNGVLGTTNSAAGSGFTTHTVSPIDSATLPSISVEESIGGGLEVFNYTDAVVNTLHLECDANGYLQGTTDLIAARQIAGVTPVADIDWDNTPMSVGVTCTVTYNGITVPAKSFSVDINNNIQADDFRLGSLYLGDITAKRREITGTFHVRESSSALWRQAVYGAQAATQPGTKVTKQGLTITINTGQNVIPGSAPGTPWSLALNYPQWGLKPFDLSPSGDDVIENDIDGQAFRPDPSVPVMTATLVNGLTELV
jgi:hypothetical protein